MTGTQRAALRKMANQLDTIIYIGKEGVTDSVVKETYDLKKGSRFYLRIYMGIWY